MFKPFQYRRLALLATLLIVAFCGLGYRLVELQVVQHDTLRDQAHDNTKRRFLREPRRGDVFDSRGNIMATSVFVKTVCADPTLIGNHQREVAHAIAPLLEMPEAELVDRLKIRTWVNDRGQTVTNQYTVLKRKVRVETWKEIQEVMKDLPLNVNESALTKSQRTFYRNLRAKAVFADALDDQMRIYPNQSLMAHVLGYVGMGEEVIDGERVNNTVGVGGIERVFNSKLRGVRGWLLTETDRRQRELVQYREQDVEPRDGLNVVLTLDATIQYIVESELAEAMKRHSPISASAIVVRPKTGAILAMASLPTFNPNDPGDAVAQFGKNRAISDISEPGSTFKIVVVSGALNDRIVTPRDLFDCERGRFVYAGKVLHDSHPNGILSVQSIITESSNIGSAKIGIKMGEASLHSYIRKFGFGDRTGISLPGEVGGIVHPLTNWNKLSISRIPMGHEVASTPLQMVMAMAAIANEGKLMRPLVVDRLVDADGRTVVKYQPEVIRQVVTPATAVQMVEALKTVVSTNGTATKAKLDLFTVAGKTGTAQKPPYTPGKYFSSFIGFFPADDPELCISVVLDEPKQGGYYGGQTAAPIFKEIAERAANYLSLRPEKSLEKSPALTMAGRK